MTWLHFSQLLNNLASFGQLLNDLATCCQLLNDLATFGQLLNDLATCCQLLNDLASFGQLLNDLAEMVKRWLTLFPLFSGTGCSCTQRTCTAVKEFDCESHQKWFRSD